MQVSEYREDVSSRSTACQSNSVCRVGTRNCLLIYLGYLSRCAQPWIVEIIKQNEVRLQAELETMSERGVPALCNLGGRERLVEECEIIHLPY